MWLKVKRMGLFTAAHFILILQLFLVMNCFHRLFGIDHLPFSRIFMFCLLISMGISLTALALSKKLALSLGQVKIISPRTTDQVGQQLILMISQLSQKARLEKAPDLGVYESEEVDAFSIGPSRNKALIALSTGLLRRMTQEQVNSILAQELSHISNGNMVNFILLQGMVLPVTFILNKTFGFLLFLILPHSSLRNKIKGIAVYSLLFSFGFFLLLFINWFSRHKDFVADQLVLRWVSPQDFISALKVLSDHPSTVTPVEDSQKILQVFKINSSYQYPVPFLSFLYPFSERIKIGYIPDEST